jgi:hypothetical protein
LRFIQRHLKQLRIAGRSLGELVSGRLGALGHSDGGMVATRLCQEAPVVDACLNMDGRAAGAPIVNATLVDSGRRLLTARRTEDLELEVIVGRR